ncbi:hypothetical protein HOLleu_06109 [Holothuria leucospilota]|uniref:SCAN box domain-containing protein n=1 Tax=Holothuria leucospilota TaxID=206669 RepID=A0A9Q1CM23_HOLLE|nr:hypothetical protein HOLleu_06109 [Holothuria leucospilota]
MATEEETKLEQYPHLKDLKADYIKHLCEENGLDLSLLKTKEDRIRALQTLPTLSDAASKSFTAPPVHRLKGFHVLNEEDDIECYLSTFERLCVDRKIPDGNWSILLEPCLTGKAQKAFYILTETQKQNYLTIKESILAAYRLTPDAFREKFHTARKLPSETFKQYGSRLNLYLRRWIKPSDGLVSMSEFINILDKLVVDQLITSLNDGSLRMKLLEQRWSTLYEFTTIADNIIIARASCRNRQALVGNTQIPPQSQSVASPVYVPAQSHDTNTTTTHQE